MAYRPHITDAAQVFSDEEIINLMPRNFSFVAQLIGAEASLHLIEEFGGTRVFVPAHHAINVNHAITHAVGLKSLQRLAEQLGKTYIEVPMGTPITIAMRNRAVRDASKKESNAKLARRFGLTLRSIRSILSSEEKIKNTVDKNYDLFAN